MIVGDIKWIKGAWGIRKAKHGLSGKTIFWIEFGDKEMSATSGPYHHSKRQALNDIKRIFTIEKRYE